MKYALVTGGNRGIGLEVCKQLVEKAKPVLLACRDVEAGEAVAEDLLATANNSSSVVKVVSLDTASETSIKQLAELVKKDYDQQIDLLVNNAGIVVPKVWDQDSYDRTLAVNVAGPVSVSQALLPLLAPGALVIMVSSELGALANQTSDYAQAVTAVNSLQSITSALPFVPDSPMGTSRGNTPAVDPAPTYNVSKALLNRAVQLMAGDEAFKHRGVSVVSTCPGWCRTDMGSAAAERSASQGAASVLWPWANWEASLNGGFTRDGGVLKW